MKNNLDRYHKQTFEFSFRSVNVEKMTAEEARDVTKKENRILGIIDFCENLMEVLEEKEREVKTLQREIDTLERKYTKVKDANGLEMKHGSIIKSLESKDLYVVEITEYNEVMFSYLGHTGGHFGLMDPKGFIVIGFIKLQEDK